MIPSWHSNENSCLKHREFQSHFFIKKVLATDKKFDEKWWTISPQTEREKNVTKCIQNFFLSLSLIVDVQKFISINFFQLRRDLLRKINFMGKLTSFQRMNEWNSRLKGSKQVEQIYIKIKIMSNTLNILDKIWPH